MDDVASVYTLITEKLTTWWELAVKMFPNFVLAIIIVLIFVFIAKIVKRFSYNIFQNHVEKKSLLNLFTSIIYVIIIFVGVFFALGVLDLDKTVTSILAGAGILGLALGFAFQDIAANFISGIILAIKSPFKVGQLIESQGIMGRVKNISLRDTEMITLQGQYVYIPNKDIFQNPIKNYSIPARTRIDLACGVSYADNLEKAREVSIKALSNVPNLLKDKNIEVFYTDFGGSSINLVCHIWIEYNSHHDFLESRSEAIISLKQAYDREGISIPFPIRTLDFGISGGEKLSEMLNVTEPDK